MENKRKCAQCNKLLKKTSNKFCSCKCQAEYQYKHKIEQWLNGEWSGTSGVKIIEISNHVRRYLFERAENKCEKCGWYSVNQFTNKIPLEIHHIDGDHTNNKEENFIVLCPNCHSLTRYYKGNNKNGRKFRKK